MADLELLLTSRRSLRPQLKGSLDGHYTELCHRWLKDGLAQLRTAHSWSIKIQYFPTMTIRLGEGVIYRTGLSTAPGVLEQIVYEMGPLLAVRLRVCERPGCGRLFIRMKRQKWCGPGCGSLVRGLKWRRAHPEEARRLRQVSYRKRRQLPDNVRISTRPPREVR
jgi:hypothetical protein